jgi:hypothetical protein
MRTSYTSQRHVILRGSRGQICPGLGLRACSGEGIPEEDAKVDTFVARVIRIPDRGRTRDNDDDSRCEEADCKEQERNEGGGGKPEHLETVQIRDQGVVCIYASVKD